VSKRRHRRERRGPKRRRRERTVEEQATRNVAARIGFGVHAMAFGAVMLLLLVTAGFLPMVIVALAWGIGLSAHGLFAVVVPVMKEDWIEDEARRLRAVATEGRAAQSQRHNRSLENLSASIAHEIRNPITAAKSLVQQMGEDPHSETNLEYARVALEELDRVESSISHLLRYAREEPVEVDRVRVEEVIDSALATLSSRMDASAVRIERAVDAPVAVQADGDKTRQVLINLVSNALDELEAASASDPVITVSAGRNLAGDGAWVRVRDNGPGIPPERLARIFDPFFTSKDDGTGLGLAISRKIAEAQGGSLEVESEMGHGTEFVLELPAHREVAE